MSLKSIYASPMGSTYPRLAPSLPAGCLLAWDAHPCEPVDFLFAEK